MSGSEEQRWARCRWRSIKPVYLEHQLTCHNRTTEHNMESGKLLCSDLDGPQPKAFFSSWLVVAHSWQFNHFKMLPDIWHGEKNELGAHTGDLYMHQPQTPIPNLNKNKWILNQNLAREERWRLVWQRPFQSVMVVVFLTDLCVLLRPCSKKLLGENQQRWLRSWTSSTSNVSELVSWTQTGAQTRLPFPPVVYADDLPCHWKLKPSCALLLFLCGASKTKQTKQNK